jgi:hypothetical protein
MFAGLKKFHLPYSWRPGSGALVTCADAGGVARVRGIAGVFLTAFGSMGFSG